MNTTSSMRRTMRASAVVALLSAMLGVGTGTARAETNPTYFTNPDRTLQVIYGGDAMAVYATIVDANNPPGVIEVCHYHGVGVMGTPAWPPHDADTTVTGPNPSRPVTIMFQQFGGNYSVNVTCNGTGNSASYSPVVY